MVFTVGHLTLHINPVQHKILVEHILYIRIHLPHRVNIFHPCGSASASFPSIPFTKEGLASPPNFLASSTASFIATPVGISSSHFSSYTASLSTVRSALFILAVFQSLALSFISASISGTRETTASYFFCMYSFYYFCE